MYINHITLVIPRKVEETESKIHCIIVNIIRIKRLCAQTLSVPRIVALYAIGSGCEFNIKAFLSDEQRI